MRSLVVLLASLPLASCVGLPGDGHFRCTRDNRCPPSAPYCHLDFVCRADPPVQLQYMDCTGTECPLTEICYSTTVGEDVAGYCTLDCSSHGDCPPFQDQPSLCIEGACARGCGRSSAIACTYPLECVEGRWDEGITAALCFSTLDATPITYYRPCTDDSQCDVPLSCIEGVCLRACPTIPGVTCAFLEVCSTSPSGAPVCLEDCSCPGCENDCEMFLGVPCVARGSGRVCLPAGW